MQHNEYLPFYAARFCKISSAILMTTSNQQGWNRIVSFQKHLSENMSNFDFNIVAADDLPH